MKNHSLTLTVLPLISAASLALVPTPASAIERKFAFTYEVTTAPKGTIELENWVTWKHSDNAAGKLDRFDFRHELEFGITDRFQASVYLADWTYNDRAPEKARYQHSGIALVYNLTNPTTDFLGSAVYLEGLVGDDNLELEGKLLLQKNFGPVIVAYNAVLEAEWEGSKLEERTGEFKQTVGVSYELTKSFSLGAEALHEIEFPDWGEAEESRVWAGPNVSLKAGRVSAVLAGLFQVTDIDEVPEVQTRLIFGIHF